MRLLGLFTLLSSYAVVACNSFGTNATPTDHVQRPANPVEQKAQSPTLREAVVAPPCAGKITIAADIFFDKGSSKLGSSERSKLDRIVSNLDWRKVVLAVTGYPDAPHAKRQRLDLAQRRAQAVQSYLIERGLLVEGSSAEGKNEPYRLEPSVIRATGARVPTASIDIVGNGCQEKP